MSFQYFKECYVCGKQGHGLHGHHIFGGSSRAASDRHGFIVWLCLEHHTGTYGVHGSKGKELSLELKQMAQREYEKDHTREEFIQEFIRSYL